MPAIFNKVWTMNSIAFCYLHPCYVCCEAMAGVAAAEDKLYFLDRWQTCGCSAS